MFWVWNSDTKIIIYRRRSQ